ncbi:MAG: tetratricopeptide repeat protein [Gammaproteobacteria bacterium]|nr:tetratricopeptide repeat protein [Gammaproteobacteria bacterium]MDH3413395.1 tetratricopeptide repeat protein [Gammaproteobacteria bacterium]
METPEQELEALKSWWNENGRTLVLGIAIGLGGVFGWTWWQNHLRAQAEEASLVYQKLTEDVTADRHDSVRTQAAAIIKTYPKSGYAALAAMLAAKSAFEEKDFNEAKRQLQWIIENSDKSSFRDVARIRLARILVQEDKLDEAMTVVEAVEEEAFGASANELRGDILITKGDREGAREAYLKVLASNTISGPTRSRVQMKLDDLGNSHAENVPS